MSKTRVEPEDDQITPAQRLRMLSGRLNVERDSVKQRLRSELKALRQRLEAAEKDLADGKHLQSFLIKNYMDIDADIARWNLSVELLPFFID